MKNLPSPQARYIELNMSYRRLHRDINRRLKRNRLREYHLPTGSLAIIMVIAITIYNHQGAYFAAFQDKEFLFIVAYYALVTSMVVSYTMRVTIALDYTTPWGKNKIRRGILQLVYSVMLPTFAFMLLYNVFEFITPEDMHNSSYFYSDIYFIMVLLLALNMWYIIEKSLYVNWLLNIRRICRDRYLVELKDRTEKQLADLLQTIGELKRQRADLDVVLDQRSKSDSEANLRYQEVARKLEEKKVECKTLHEALEELSIQKTARKTEQSNIVVQHVDRTEGYKIDAIAYMHVKDELISLQLRDGRQEIMTKIDSLAKALALFPQDACMKVNKNTAVVRDAIAYGVDTPDRSLMLVLDDQQKSQIAVYSNVKQRNVVRDWLLRGGVTIKRSDTN